MTLLPWWAWPLIVIYAVMAERVLWEFIETPTQDR